jgi:hypothetical protein
VIIFEAYGVSMWVGTNRREARERIPEVLPPGWEPRDSVKDVADHRLAILGDDRGTYGVDLGGSFLIEGASLDLALEILDGVVRSRLASAAPDKVFVHAGAVAYGGTALLVPAPSFAGKTTLVAGLVRAGATYYSDEFAPLDADGLVHPYAKPLSLRGADHVQTDHHVESLGGIAGEEPLPVGVVVVTTFRPGAEWRPKRLSAGEGALALLSNAVPARKRPAQALRAATRAADGAVFLEGDRGEAEDIVPTLLAELRARAT